MGERTDLGEVRGYLCAADTCLLAVAVGEEWQVGRGYAAGWAAAPGVRCLAGAAG